ncbi:hypothetical protein ES707_00196 [subsurface metagenome]
MNWLDLITNIISRVPIERVLFSPRDNTKALEEFVTNMKQTKSQKEAPSEQKTTSTIQEPAKSPETVRPEVAETITEEGKASSIEAGCVPCSLGHLSVCSGLINEAMRFGRSDGMDSNEVIDRVSHCLSELNALEREDLTSEMIIDLPSWEKEIAVDALETSRSTRHLLEKITTTDELEKAAAKTQTAYTQISRRWFKERVARMPQEEKAELAKKAMKQLEES